MDNSTQNIIIPELRQDLKVHPGGHDFDGAPTWLIYDPLSDNYYKIGWFEFECLKRMDRAKSSNDLVSLVNNETPLSIENEDVVELIGFLMDAGLLQAYNAEIRKIVEDRSLVKKPSLLHTMFFKYIFIRVPLFNPQQFLTKTFPFISFMFTKTFLLCVAALMSVGIFLTIQRWDEFLNTFTFLFSLENVILIVLATIIIKTVHEFGHAYMAHAHKVPVMSMGAIFIVLYPILYTETTNAWRIYNRKKRMQIAAAGVMAELSMASVALIIWHVSTPGLLQNLSYFVGFISLFISIFINANPLMRFDGYYLLSDLLGIDNLQPRAFAFFKWKLRNVVCALDEDAPEIVPTKQRRFLTIFGAAQAIYMCFLYSGIALAIYILVFKPLGFLMAMTMLAAFLGMPILRELLHWGREYKAIMKKNKPRIIFAALACLIVLSFFPLSRNVTVPGVLHYKDYQSFYVSMPARIDEIRVNNLQESSKGDILMILSSDTLEQEIQIARLDLQRYQKLYKRQQASAELSRNNIELNQMIKESRTKLAGLIKERDSLTIRAPFDGVVKDISADIHEGRWINSGALLMQLINKEKMQVTAYADSQFIERIQKPAKGSFRSDTQLFGSQDIELLEIASADTKSISYPELSSVYKGPIPADNLGELGVQSKIPLYTLKFDVIEPPDNADFTKKGSVRLQVQPASFFGNIFERLASLFLRETGV